MAKKQSKKQSAGQWPALGPGDIVDIVAPGFRCSDEHLDKAADYVRSLGLEPRVPSDLFADDILCANTDAYRFQHLKKALSAKDSQAVWCVRAGYGAIRFIGLLAKMPPPKSKKIFIGYSDVTLIHAVLNHKWGWPTLHGPVLDRLGQGEKVPPEEMQEMKDVIFGHQTVVKFEQLTALNKAAEKTKLLRGRVFGGNLSVFQTLAGTSLLNFKDDILFFEDVSERGYRVDRMLNHLRLAGVFKKVKAVVFGTFTLGQEKDGRNLLGPVLKRFADESKFPVLLGMHAGHGDFQRPVFFHSPAQLRPSAGELLIETSVALPVGQRTSR